MFGKTTPSWQARGAEVTFIAAECQVTGSLNIKGDARIDGQVEGNVKATGELTIGPGAVVKANIEANSVSIAGEVRGDIKALDTLELAASARLYGDICTRQLKIEQGARFVGSSQLLEDNNAAPDTSSKTRQEKKEVRNRA